MTATILISAVALVAGVLVGRHLPRLYPKWPIGTVVRIADEYVEPLDGDPSTTGVYLGRSALTHWHKVQVFEGPYWWSVVRYRKTITINGKWLSEVSP